MTDSSEGVAPGVAKKRAKHPFRQEAVDWYERPFTPTTPLMLPHWPWKRAVLAVLLLVLVLIMWRR